MARRLILLLALLLPGLAAAQTVQTITPAGLGYPVPVPVAAPDPFDGFRTMEAINARLVGLVLDSPRITAHNVGPSLNARPITAYRITGAGTTTAEGFPRGGVYLNGTIHAREWSSPETVTAIIEWLVANDDDPLRDSILEQLEIVALPISNPDGFLTTQRSPAQTVNGGTSGASGWDGRMRRKNHRNSDEILTTTADAFNGVDLNRNHEYGFINASSSPTSIGYRGTAPGSEPETNAIYTAATLFRQDRLRLAIDYHSYSQLYYVIVNRSPNRDAATRENYQLMRAASLAATGLVYTSIETDLETEAIGATDEYFTGRYAAMSYTCEARPIFGTNGFILPESQVAPLRAEMLAAARASFTYATGPAAITRIALDDVDTTAVLQLRVPEPATAMRRVETPENFAFTPGARHRVVIDFDRPVRQVAPDGSGTLLPGVTADATPRLTTAVGTFSDPEWETARHRGDRLVMTLAISTQAASGTIAPVAIDLVGPNGLPIDGDPATVADWSPQGWVGWERNQADALWSIAIGAPAPRDPTAWQLD